MIYIDTAHLETMLEMIEYPWISGFTCNPTLLHQEGISSLELIEALPPNFDARVFIQLEGSSEKAMLNHYRKIKKNQANLDLAFKIPLNRSGIETIRHLRRLEPDIIILATAIYSSNQAMFAGVLDCDYVAPYYNRIENEGFSAPQVLAETRSFYQEQGIKTKIMAASFKNIHQVKKAFLSGADLITMSPDLYHCFYQNKASQTDIDAFNEL